MIGNAAVPGEKSLALESLLRGIADPITPYPRSRQPDPAGATPAAVLIPIVVTHSEPQILLTVRHQDLSSHPGQISFPGGRVDLSDLDVAHTAAREAHEEVGLAPADIKILGALPPCLTGTGFSVVPVLGLVPFNYPYRLAKAEVAKVFHVPLGFLLDASNRQRRQYEMKGQQRQFYEYWFGDYRIWGATAQMIVGLDERLASRSLKSALLRLWT